MRISPIDIQQQQFKSRPFGYEKSGVDQFLEMLAEELERLIRQNQDLQEELARTKATLNEMRDREATLKETLITTQKMTDELKTTARKEVDVMMADAELRAERLMRNAEERRIKLIEEIQEIKRQKIDFESSLRTLLEKHVRMLDLNVVSIESDEETKLIEEPLPFEDAEVPSPEAVVEESVEPVADVEVSDPPEVESSPGEVSEGDASNGISFDFDTVPEDDEEPLK